MFFCYILCFLNEKYLNGTYIGFTDNLFHRNRRHNGETKGRAKFIKRRRQWKLVKNTVASNYTNKCSIKI